MKTILYIFLSVTFFSCTTKHTYDISEFHQNGNKKIITKLENNKVVARITYNDKGDMLTREEFFLNKLHGIWKELELSNQVHTEYFGNGNKRTEGVAIDGKLEGRRSYYNRDGHLDKEKYFNNGVPTDFWVVYNHDKGLKSIRDYGLHKNNGTWTQYYKNGNLMKITNFNNKQLHGEYLEYYPGGDIKIIGNYNKGKRIGKWIKYTNSGDISNIENYSNGLFNGLWKLFHSNGSIKLIGEYENNYRVGTWKWLDRNGELVHSRQY